MHAGGGGALQEGGDHQGGAVVCECMCACVCVRERATPGHPPLASLPCSCTALSVGPCPPRSPTCIYI